MATQICFSYIVGRTS